jgi:hypothetical protein
MLTLANPSREVKQVEVCFATSQSSAEIGTHLINDLAGFRSVDFSRKGAGKMPALRGTALNWK